MTPALPTHDADTVAPAKARTDANANRPAEIRVATPFGKLAGLQWGDPGAAPLLALHGWLDNAAGFARLAPLLATQRHVIALDLPGHGHSAHLGPGVPGYHIIDQVDHVRDSADALGLDHFDLLGHSRGAGIASLFAAAAPGRVDKLMLVEGLGPVADDGSRTLAHWRVAHEQRARGQRAPRIFASIDDAVAARVASGGLDPDEARPIVERNLRQVETGYVWCSDARLRLATALLSAESQVRSLLTGIEAATLLILARPETPYLPAALMDQRISRVRNIRVEHIAGPHHLHIRESRSVAACLSRFLEY